MTSRKFLLVGVAIVICSFAIAFFGLAHIISGSGYNGPWIVKKSSFGFAETFVNTDQVGGMPYIAAKIQFPLSVLALQRAGYLETDEVRESRIQKELQAISESLKADADREIRKAKDELQASIQKLKDEADRDRRMSQGIQWIP